MLRNILAVIAGIIVGSIVNMAVVIIGPMVVPPPAGVDMTTVEGLKAGAALLGPQHYLPPFFAHALGAIFGGFIAAKLAVGTGVANALIVGAFFLLGGIAAATMIPAPMWFLVLDLVVAYIPMAWLGGRIAARS